MRLLLPVAQKQTVIKRARWSLALLLFLQPIFITLSSHNVSALSGVSGSVVINEFSSYGSSDWVELYNTTANPVTLAGWQIRDQAGMSVSLAADAVSGHGYYVVTLPSDFLNDTTDTIRLLDDTSAEISALTYAAGSAILPSESGKSTARTQDGGAVWTAGVPTKGMSNVIPDVVPPAPPTGGAPNGTLHNANFDFTWQAPSDTQAPPLDFELRASRDGNQLTIPDGSSTAWYSGLLHYSSIAASLVENLSISNGMWYWQVRSVDEAGNRSAWSDIWNVDIDTSQPGIIFQSPTPGELFGKVAKPQLMLQSTIAEDQIKSYAVSLDGSDVTSQTEAIPREAGMTVKMTFLTGNLVDGSHQIVVHVEDAAGNVSEAEQSFAVDNTAPELTTPLENDTTLQSTATLQLNANEAGSYNVDILNSKGVSVKANAMTLSANEEKTTLAANSALTYKWDTTQVEDGTYTIRFTGVDLAGNTVALTRTVTVDNIFDGGIGVIGDPLLERLSASLTEPFMTPQAVTIVPSEISPSPKQDIDESTLAATGDAKTPGIIADSLPPVAATESGWRILGILWYWWLLGGALLGLLGYRSWQFARQFWMASVKNT